MILLSEILDNIINEKCWDGYRQLGVKNKGGKTVPNCIRIKEAEKTKGGKNVKSAYLTKNKSAMKREIDRVSKLKSNDPSAYGKWEADYADKGKTKKFHPRHTTR